MPPDIGQLLHVDTPVKHPAVDMNHCLMLGCCLVHCAVWGVARSLQRVQSPCTCTRHPSAGSVHVYKTFTVDRSVHRCRVNCYCSVISSISASERVLSFSCAWGRVLDLG